MSEWRGLERGRSYSHSENMFGWRLDNYEAEGLFRFFSNAEVKGRQSSLECMLNRAGRTEGGTPGGTDRPEIGSDECLGKRR